MDYEEECDAYLAGTPNERKMWFFSYYRMHFPGMDLIDGYYDNEHHGMWMAEKKPVFGPLRLRSHEACNKKNMPYDERYTPFIERLDLLPWISLVTRSTPPMNPCAITALVDRWRPETHSFHLRTGEMTVTLQDVSMIDALPIEGNPLCMNTNSKGWRGQMEDLIGMSPPLPEDPKNTKVTAGGPYSWIVKHSSKCPADADDDVIQQYARVYVWYVITRTLFAGSSGSNAPWMWLKALTIWDSSWSWGSVALAYLYHQLDDACRRRLGDAGIAGPLFILSVWMWERFPVGRPVVAPTPKPWDDHGHPLRKPTWAYKWDVVSAFSGEPKKMYIQYTNEFDALTSNQVNWELCSVH
ncbi:unnamed protein product [Alopecurus aequalis]